MKIILRGHFLGLTRKEKHKMYVNDKRARNRSRHSLVSTGNCVDTENTVKPQNKANVF